MAGVALLIDLWRKNPSFTTTTTTFAVSTFAAAAASSQPLLSRFYGDAGIPIAYADAGADVLPPEIYLPSLGGYLPILTGNIVWKDFVALGTSSTKIYPIELKPLFSAFYPKNLGLVTLRSLAVEYLPLFEPPSLRSDDEDDDFPDIIRERPPKDLVLPFIKAMKMTIRETTVMTTRRVLERVAVHNVSQRMAWKLIKDVPRSARRKAERNMSSFAYCYSVGKTTFRGHILVVTASWLVQVGIEIYRFFSSLTDSEEANNMDKGEPSKLLGKKILGTTIKCGSSIIFASIGAGIGATLVNPHYGQIGGCILGDLLGPMIVKILIEKGFHVKLF